ncbi:hypothetical protein MTIM_53440 [Mycobacterium timonense]|uniref:Uncharacterized protein n=1 Tax=Mycobacterium timonense TaxID=701043 RepID=A0A7I9ZF24_9MYCO|nr:hypothetical protein MTIM_53440 [Mycobacterium timonense]
MVHDQNAVTAVAEAVARLGRHQFPLVLTDTVAQFLEAVSEETGLTFDTDWATCGSGREVGADGPHAQGRAARHRQPDDAQGRKANVVPAIAEAVVDCRILPGRKEAFEAEIDELLGRT